MLFGCKVEVFVVAGRGTWVVSGRRCVSFVLDGLPQTRNPNP